MLVRETPDDDVPVVPKSLLTAFATGTAEGIVHSAGLEQTLPLSFAFARGVARLYFAELSRVIADTTTNSFPPTPSQDFTPIVRQAPPMIGLEYLTPEIVGDWWNQMDMLVRAESAVHADGAAGWLREHNPAWRSIGRVTVHLAENKHDPEHPFAFIATLANGLTPQGRVRHEPLGRALEQYAGAKNRLAMLKLLTPVAKAAESVAWLRVLVESDGIFQPLAWTAEEAYAFHKSVPHLEAAGLVVRVPDW